MSGFVLVGNPGSEDLSTIAVNAKSALAAMERKGIRRTACIEAEQAALFLFANDHHDPAAVMSSSASGDFLTYVGTLFYRGMTGRQATAQLLEDLSSVGDQVLDDLHGMYCLIVKQGRGVRLLPDRADAYHLFTASENSLVTTSFIAAAASAKQSALDVQAVYEYVLNGATFGDQTLVTGVRRSGTDEELRLTAGRLQRIRRPSLWLNSESRYRGMSVEDHLDVAEDRARSYFAVIAKTFPMTMGLSGGYDSRLMLAFALQTGAQPDLYVYGADADADVVVARRICESEGFDLQTVNRASISKLEPDDYWNNQEDVFHKLDGLTPYGFACNPDEVLIRIDRVRSGQIALNGGGGEIWRDFWQLPDRPFSVSGWLRSFYDQSGEEVFTAAANRKTYLRRLEEKAVCVIGSKSRRSLRREEIESLYPRFRLRYWQGPNNCANNIVGPAVAPFVEPQFTVPAMWVPMREKYHGRFERKLLIRQSERLARYPSSYGYDFVSGPKFVDRSTKTLKRHFPASLRPIARHAGLGTRGRGPYKQFPYFLDRRYVQSRFGSGDLEIESLLRMDALHDPLAYSRALTVERMLRGDWSVSDSSPSDPNFHRG